VGDNCLSLAIVTSNAGLRLERAPAATIRTEQPGVWRGRGARSSCGDAPRLRRGTVLRPNLFIIGAAKCGTTSLHHFLAQHPDVFMSHLKEPGFFVPEFRYHPKDPDWYLGLFAEAVGVRYAGESSTHYTKRPLFEGVAQRLYAFSPDARLIYVMRDPIERAISHYWHNTRSVRPEFHEKRPMLEALTQDPLYMAYGDYAMQLEPWLKFFGSDMVLTLVYEEVIQDQETELDRLLAWLGQPPMPEGAGLERRNARPETITTLRGGGILERFRRSTLWDRLSPLAPRFLKDQALKLTTRQSAQRQEDRSDEARQRLRPIAREQVRRLEELLERSFPLWTTTSGDAGSNLKEN